MKIRPVEAYLFHVASNGGPGKTMGIKVGKPEE
jgi:hypothetical protein